MIGRAVTATAAGMFLAVGVPPAHADILDDVIDPVQAAVAPAMDATDPAEPVQQLVFTPLHNGIQDWIHSSIGGQIDDVINKLAGSFVIGDGAPGTETHPAGGTGGWLFGDGGDGWNSTVAGQPGGNGGDAPGLFGVGGNGGNGGNGGTDIGLPALGGAGGNGGLFGSHGDVGHFGTIDGAPPTGSSDLTVTGSWLTDSDGRVVVIHGINHNWKVPPFEPSADGFSADDAAFLEANGFNAVRLGFAWEAVEPEPGVFNDAYLASVAQTVQTLADHHIAVLLYPTQGLYSETFGGQGAPEWAVQTGGLPNTLIGNLPITYVVNPAENHAWNAFWANADAPNGVGLENSYAQMWEYVANYFKGDPDVVGYEITNEPWPGSQALATLLGSPHFDQQVLTPFYNQVDSAIRAVDPTTTVFFQPNIMFGNLPVNTHLGTVDDPNSVFSFHDYCLTTDLIGGTSLGCVPYDELIQGWADKYAKAHDIPAFMTEFGSTPMLKTIADMLPIADKHQVNWTEFAYGVSAVTSSSPTGQALVFNPNLPPTGDNVNTAKLEILAEPYPQTVAGTPDSWSFHDGIFQLSNSTERADGDGSFAPGSQTTISVPAVEYPNGYQVSVTGGQVVSPPNAPELVIASNPGAGTVTVTVSGSH